MKLIIKEEKYDLSWKEHDVKMRVDGEMGTYPSYAKRVGNLVVNIDPEVFNNGEFGYTVYYTPHIGRAGFKKAESGFMNSSEAMDYADTYIFGASDFVDPFWESKARSNRSTRKLIEQDVEIEVKNKGILEVPEGKNVDDLPMSHFEKLAKKKGLGKITKALNNLQVWNKNDDPKLSKWAGDMIDKLNKKLKKDESFIKESGAKSYWSYDLMDVDDDRYYDKQSIRRIKLTPCDNPDDCYADFGDTTSWAVCDTDYGNEVFCTKDQAYSYLLDTINRNRYEREHDI